MIKYKNPIVIGKHDSNFDYIEDCKNKGKRIRIGSSNPQNLKWIDYNVISANSSEILFNGQYYSIGKFFEHVKKLKVKNIMVLTQKEHEYIISKAVAFKVEIHIFEKYFPFFPDIKFVKNLPDNINQAKKRLNDCKLLGIKGGSAKKWVSTLFRYKQERKLRIKNNLDDIVYFSCLPPYQEVFKAKESVMDRTILALDFNAMFTDCLSGKFPSPKDLRYSEFFNAEYSKNSLMDGFYRVRLLRAKDTFFLKYHPFRYSSSNLSFNFELSLGASLEVFLPRDEIDYYSTFFESVEVIEGIYSNNQISHPLLPMAESLYSIRNNYSRGSPRELFAKFSANIISSLGNPRRYRRYLCKDKQEAISLIEKKFSIRFDNNMSFEQKINYLTSGNRVRFNEETVGKYNLEMINIENTEAIYSIYSKIISNSRLKMLKLIEELSQIPSFELCYANVDSIHISVKNENLEKIYSVISNKISNKIGDLKIESISTSGYWFDLGRYWLLNSNEIIKYSNFLFKRNHSTDPIITERVIKKVMSLYGYKFVKSFKIRLEKSFSSKKFISYPNNLDEVYYNRYDYNDVFTASVASNSVLKEKIRSYPLKSYLLKELATVKCSTNHIHINCDNMSC